MISLLTCAQVLSCTDGVLSQSSETCAERACEEDGRIGRGGRPPHRGGWTMDARRRIPHGVRRILRFCSLLFHLSRSSLIFPVLNPVELFLQQKRYMYRHPKITGHR